MQIDGGSGELIPEERHQYYWNSDLEKDKNLQPLKIKLPLSVKVFNNKSTKDALFRLGSSMHTFMIDILCMHQKNSPPPLPKNHFRNSS